MAPWRGPEGAPVWVIGSHRLARTSVAAHLAASVRRPVAAGEPHELGEASVIVFLAAHEPPNTLPRVLRALNTRGARVIVGYDAALATDDVTTLLERFGIWAQFDVRGDRATLVALVQRALSAPARVAAQSPSPVLSRWHVPSSPRSSGLTARERDVVRLMCGDRPVSAEEAAATLHISIHTLNTHLRNVRRKLEPRYTGNRDALRDALADLGWLE